MLKFHETKSRTKLNELYVFDKKQLNRAALVRQDEKDFKGWKKLSVKITQTFGDYPFGLQYFALESESSSSAKTDESNKMSDECSTPLIIRGSTLDIPFLSDDDEPMISGQDQLEEARKMAKTKLTLSPALNITPDLGSSSSTPSKPKKRTLPSGIAAKPQKTQKKNDLSDDSEKSDKETKKKTKKPAAKTDKKRPKFKSISDDDDDKASASDSSSKKKKTTKKADAKKPTKRKTTKKKKTLDDPSDTDDEEELIDNASDADENGNLAGFVVSNKTVIKDNKKLQDGPVCTNKTDVLQGCIIAISGIQNPKRTEIREAAMAIGAKYRPQYTADTTHLIAAFVDDRNEKSKQAKKAGAFIVNAEWVFDCEKNSRRMNESKYSMLKDESEDEIEGSDEEYQLSSSSDDLLGDGEDREYRPKRKKRKVVEKKTRSVKKESDDETNDDGNESDKSLGKSNSQSLAPPPIVKSEKKENSQVKSEVNSDEQQVVADIPIKVEELKVKEEESKPIAQDCAMEDDILSSSDEQEVLRLKSFYDSGNYSKSFSDFIVEDIFALAYQTAQDGELFDYFDKWSLKTPSPKFIRMIARSSVEGPEEVVKQLDECRDNILKYIEVNFASKKPKTDGSQRQTRTHKVYHFLRR
ncbi:BRCT domain-containing protein [Naegleria gruberi]|uniref:BRCT domain-containing protein n=1 Tax=Naegleria gruberi TaxID=5762 RepID=D2V9M2_NAEGR|nr:BRCT domain-containing protein [Naegleria gruberi]EFC46489.1 BRCT domain-containing protein [Naegleria gruberi]|eukprot:XP_002679233.1 BRCT domain-containing protein [Naegleria gruberi strain NEG-M]